MPSPVGHALGGVAAGWMVRGNRLRHAEGRREAIAFAALGALADLDLLFGIHSGPTHGIGTAVAASAAAWLPGLWGATRQSRARLMIAAACMLAYGSHILLDWLGSDSSPPIGIMALWPFSREYFESGLHLFMAVSRRIRRPELFWWQNTVALGRELLILTPMAVAVGWAKRVEAPR